MKKFFATPVILISLLALAVTVCWGMPVPAAGHAALDQRWLWLGIAGLVVDRESLGAVFININALFNNAFSAAPTQWSQTAMLVPSGTSEERYDWLDRFPMMRKWVGDKVIKALKAWGYSIVNDDWEATISVLRRWIQDDRLGMINPQAQQAGWAAAQWPDELVAALKNNAFTALCYDGQYFYDTDHPVGSGTLSNKGTAALRTTNRTTADASYGAARIAIQTLTDFEGRPLALVSDLLEVPPALEATATTLLTAQKLDDNSPNPYQGTAKLLVNPRLTSSTAWFLHVSNMPLKPYIYQERIKAHPVQQIDPQSEPVFMRAEFYYGVEARGAGGYGLWQLSYGSTGAA